MTRQLPGNDDTDDFAAELAAFEVCLAESRAAPLEEAVPAEMMQVFSDEQWPDLLFELQPSVRFYSATRDVVSLHGPDAVADGDPLPGPMRHWLIFRQGDEQLIRPLRIKEFRALGMTRNGANFAAMADALWPELDIEARHREMTDMLLDWLREGLVIDAGVPLPEDAEVLD